MRTYSHGIIAYILYLKKSSFDRRLAVFGAMIPDLFLVLGFLFHIGSGVVIDFFHDLFHFGLFGILTELFHSFLFVLLLFFVSFVFFKKYMPFVVGMFTHIIVDLLTHQKWVYNHLYPLPVSPFISPVSYMTLWFTILEHVFVLVFLLWFFRKRLKKFYSLFK